jgi:protein-S-isoprenylcysteine O-methyltransferase Ste14
VAGPCPASTVLPAGYAALVELEFALAALTFVVLRLVPAPYGRHARAGWGPTIPERIGWILMESPAVLFFAAVYLAGSHRGAAVPLALLFLWQLHYLQRTFVFPFRLRASGRRMPLLIVVLAFVFNLLNGDINARWISEFGQYPNAWFSDPRFLAGTALFLAGLTVNIASDRTLLRLRAPGETGHRIPRGGLFGWVSCPNYLGEMVEWFGWALATWSWAGLAFAVYTVANLAPRALAHHAWYRERFPDYPRERRALLPHLL